MIYTGTKRRVFISHFREDEKEVNIFIEQFANKEKVFTPYVLGANNNDDFIDSTDTDYVMSQIRQKYLKDSTVTIVLIGSCTHSRRYVDWEIKSSLTQGEQTPNGLLGILLPNQGTKGHLPDRFKLNWSREADCYSLYKPYPTSAGQLGRWIGEAYERRTTRQKQIENPKDMMKYNQKCKTCGETH